MKKLQRYVRTLMLMAFMLSAVFLCENAYAEAAAGTPAKVSGLTLKVNCQPSAKLSWDDLEGEDGYVIYRNNQSIAEVNADVVSYTDRTIEAGQSYSYKVRAFVKNGDAYTYGSPSSYQKITNGYIWAKAEDGTAALTGYTGKTASLAIPDSIGGKAVTIVGEACFQGNAYIENVTIPESVVAIDNYGFEACSAIKKVSFPASLKTIGEGAFSGCADLKMADLPDGVVSIGRGAFLYCTNLSYLNIPKGLETLGRFAFAGCSRLRDVELTCESLTEIPDRAFCNCKNLEAVKFGDSIKSIGKRAFSNCESLSTLDIPATIESIGDYAFENCAADEFRFNENTRTGLGFAVFRLQTYGDTPDKIFIFQPGLYVTEGTFYGSPYTSLTTVSETPLSDFQIIDGSLYTADGKTMMAYFPNTADPGTGEISPTKEAAAGVFTVPDGVERIAPYAFYQASLSKVYLPESLLKIDHHAFAGAKVSESALDNSKGAQVQIDEKAFEGSISDDASPDDPEDGSEGDLPYNPDTDERTDEEDPVPSIEFLMTSFQDDYSPESEKEQFSGYLDVHDYYIKWVESYLDYNKNIMPTDGKHIPYIIMYKGEEHYRQMTSALNHDRYKTNESIQRSGDDYEEMYLMIDHGLAAELSRGLMPNDLLLYSGITPERVADIAGVDKTREDVTSGAIAANVKEELKQAAQSHKELSDVAFQSTTADLRTAFSFGSYAKTIVRIYASNEALDALGSYCIDSFMEIYDGMSEAEAADAAGEEETLLNMNASYKVLDAGNIQMKEYSGDKIDNERTYTYITLEMLGGEDPAKPKDGSETLTEPEYIWAKDYSSCTATIYDETGAIIETETTTDITKETIQEATQDENGLIRYTAKFKNDSFDANQKDVTIDSQAEKAAKQEASEKLTSLLIDINENLDVSLYKPETRKALENAISEANALLDDESATSEQLRKARSAVLKARKNLKKRDSISGAQITGLANVTYTGEAFKPVPSVTLNGAQLKAGTDYTVSYKNNINAGAATVTVSGTGNYKDTADATFTISKADKDLTLKGKKVKVKYSKLKTKKKVLKRSSVIKISGAKGKITYKKLRGNKKILVNKTTGKVTVKKKLKKGTYKVKVQVSTAGDMDYNPQKKNVTFKIKVK